MLHRLLFFSLALLTMVSFSDEDTYRTVPNQSFTKNEVLEYSVSYGFITAGNATVQVSPTIHKVNGRPCYKVDVFGNTSGAFDLITKIRDNWGTYLDTASMIPHISYRKLYEGNHKHNEVIRFDHNTDMAELKAYRFSKKEWHEPAYFKMPKNIQDMVSGYYFLRTLDFNKYKQGDTIKVNAFFEGDVYDFRILFGGRREIDTKYGKINSIVLVPVMPDNKIFAGENAITVYISDDKNRIPLKVHASLFLGSAELELESYSGLKRDFLPKFSLKPYETLYNQAIQAQIILNCVAKKMWITFR